MLYLGEGRIAGAGAETVTITKNEILTTFNKPDNWLLALVQVPTDEQFGQADAYRVAEPRTSYGVTPGCLVRYLKHPFTRELDFGVTSVNYDWKVLWCKSAI